MRGRLLQVSALEFDDWSIRPPSPPLPPFPPLPPVDELELDPSLLCVVDASFVACCDAFASPALTMLLLSVVLVLKLPSVVVVVQLAKTLHVAGPTGTVASAAGANAAIATTTTKPNSHLILGFNVSFLSSCFVVT